MRIVMLFSSNSRSISKIFYDSLIEMGHSVKLIDPDSEYLKSINDIKQKLSNKVGNKKLIQYVIEQTSEYKNRYMLDQIEQAQPELVISYNDSFLKPETVEIFKKYSNFMLYLGDNPFYSFNKSYYLQITLAADLIITPDTGCQEQLIASGIKNVNYGILGIDGENFKKINTTKKDRDKYETEVFYLGTIHGMESWAHKRPLFLTNFVRHNIQIYGNHQWHRILPLYPELEPHFNLLETPMPIEELNIRMNCSKIYPVDAHPGIINGLHARIFDAIGAGIVPVVEYRRDIDKVFIDMKPPSFKNFDEARKLASYYIENDSRREELAVELNQFLMMNYKSKDCVNRMLSAI